jgi:tetratricopeptide (TPR) repeat protein
LLLLGDFYIFRKFFMPDRTSIQRFFLLALSACLCLTWTGCGRGDSAREKEGAARSSRAKALYEQRDYAQALEAAREVMALAGDLNTDSMLAEGSLLAGRCMRELGQYDSALSSLQNALLHFRATGDQSLERRGRIALAEFYALMENNEEALTAALSAAGTAKVFSDRKDEFTALQIAAASSHRLGRYEQEIGILDELIRLDSAHEGGRNAVDLAGQKIVSLRASGQIDRARTALAGWRWTPPAGNSSAARTLYACGMIERREGRPDSAIRAFSQALGIADGTTDRLLQATILTGLGCLSYRSGHYDNARMYLGDARKSAEQMDILPFQEMLEIALLSCDWKASPRRQRGVPADLLERCDHILAACRQAGFTDGEALALFLRTRMREPYETPDTLLPSYLGALSLAEQSAALFPDEGAVGMITETLLEGEHSGWYDPAVGIACGASRCDQAFDLIERKNLQDISRFFSRLTVRTSREPLNQSVGKLEWRWKEAHVLNEDILGELSRGKKMSFNRLQALDNLIPVRAAEIAQAEAELHSLNANIEGLFSRRAPALREVRDTLPAGSALLEYAPLQDALAILVITRDTCCVRSVPATGSRLGSLIAEYTRDLADPRLVASPMVSPSPASVGRINELASVLGNFLIEPVLPALRGITKLYVVPPREFSWLPFHTLRAGGAVLIDRFSVSYLPSAAVLFWAGARQEPVTSIIGIGHPGRTNWDVEYELKDIRGFYEKARMLFYSSARLSELDTAAYQVLHFAAEFGLDTGIPDNSALNLSDGKTPFGFRGVSLGEVFGVRPPQALIFSNITPEPGQFSRYAPLAFLANGTPVVIATMWQGERKAKKYFGEIFYTSLQAGTTAAEAYQNAIVALGKKSEFAPLYRRGLYYQFGR